jgi:hypothetical protein
MLLLSVEREGAAYYDILAHVHETLSLGNQRCVA